MFKLKFLTIGIALIGIISSGQVSAAAPLTADEAAAAKLWSLKYNAAKHRVRVDPRTGRSYLDVSPAELQVIHNSRGRSIYTANSVTTLSRSPVLKSNAAVLLIHTVTPDVTTFRSRPTLFISLQGAAMNSGLDPWQKTNGLTGVLINALSDQNDLSRLSQFVHYAIDWDSKKTIYSQINILTDEVNSFLNQRAYPWDVVVIGFSRGGIFASQLSAKIYKHSNINNLHTVLLDPTAAISTLADVYPSHNYAPGSFGSLFYDANVWGIVFGLTKSDLPIPGYDNYGRGQNDFLFAASSHAKFATEWVEEVDVTLPGIQRTLNDIWSKKIPGTFAQDGDTNSLEEIKINAQTKPVTVDFNISLQGGNLRIASHIAVGSIPIFNFTGNGSLRNPNLTGPANIDFALGTMLQASQLTINKDALAVGMETNGIGLNAVISGKTGIAAQFNILGALATASVGNGDLAVSATLFNQKLSFSLKNTSQKVSDRISKAGPKDILPAVSPVTAILCSFFC